MPRPRKNILKKRKIIHEPMKDRTAEKTEERRRRILEQIASEGREAKERRRRLIQKKLKK